MLNDIYTDLIDSMLYSASVTTTIDPVGLGSEALVVSTPGSAEYPMPTMTFIRPQENLGRFVISPASSAELSLDSTPQGLINAYYSFFHANHPFLLPQAHMMDHLNDFRFRELNLAIRYIGSFYVDNASVIFHQQNLKNALHQTFPMHQKHPSVVQALLLYAIGLHMDDKEHESAVVLTNAVRSAFDVGLNRVDCAEAYGCQGTLMEESYRRTFWEIYVVDGMFAGLNPQYTLQMRDDAVETFPLPLEDSDFHSGVS
jgi:hypothetical protein